MMHASIAIRIKADDHICSNGTYMFHDCYVMLYEMLLHRKNTGASPEAFAG